MLFKFHMSLAVCLIALVAGMYLVTKVRSEGTCCKGFAKAIGYFVVVLSFLMIICSVYHGVVYWKAGYFCHSKMGRGMHMMHRGKMKHMREKCPYMMEGQEEEGEEKKD